MSVTFRINPVPELLFNFRDSDLQFLPIGEYLTTPFKRVIPIGTYRILMDVGNGLSMQDFRLYYFNQPNDFI